MGAPLPRGRHGAAHRTIVILGVAAALSTTRIAAGVGSELELHLHSELDFVPETPTDIPADAALLPVGANAITTRASGSQWDFTGATTGSSMWVLPKDQGDELWLSIGLEHLDPADFATSTLMFTVLGVSGTGGGPAPGVFSIWDGGNVFAPSSPVPLVSTGTSLPGGNSFTVGIGGHEHYNYGFTAPGLYDVAVQVSGTLAGGGGPVTGSAVYTFGVFTSGDDYPFDNPPTTPFVYQGRTFNTVMFYDAHVDLGVDLMPVPEPATWTLTAFAGVSLAVAVACRRPGRKWRNSCRPGTIG